MIILDEKGSVRPSGRPSAAASIKAAFVGLLAAGVMLMLVLGASGASAIGLGTAQSFAILAGSGVTNTGATTVNGDLGTYPTETITGSSTMTVNGTNHGGDGVAQQAKTDLVTAYNAAAGAGPHFTAPISRGSRRADRSRRVSTTPPPRSSLSGALTLDGAGDPERGIRVPTQARRSRRARGAR